MGRQIALLGDAELDEGAVWEAIADPWVAHLGEVLWVVDLNRQSLDRVVPDIAFGRLAGMFEAAGWQVITVKYGRLLDELFDARRAATRSADASTRCPTRSTSGCCGRTGPSCASACPAPTRELAKLVAELDDAELRAGFRDLGGHDLGKLIDAYRAADHDRPTVVFAYTIKGWSLPIEGHPENHSALLTNEQFAELAAAARHGRRAPLGALRAGQPGGRALRRRGRRARPRGAHAARAAAGPGRARPRAPRQGVDAAGLRALLRRPRPRGARRSPSGW